MQITPAIRARIAKLHQDGISAVDISSKIGCSKSSVYRVLEDIDQYGECALPDPAPRNGWMRDLWSGILRRMK